MQKYFFRKRGVTCIIGSEGKFFSCELEKLVSRLHNEEITVYL